MNISGDFGMHVPSFWVHIYLRLSSSVRLGHVAESIYASMLGIVAQSLIRPQSMEFRVPGKATVYKYPGSIDGSSYWDDSLDMELLPCEEVLSGPGVTKLAEPSKAMDITSKNDHFKLYVKHLYSDFSKRFLDPGADTGLRVSCACWGLTRCSVYDRATKEIREDWYLRGRLARQGHFTPILMMLFSHPIDKLIWELNLTILSYSHIYSHFEYGEEDPAILVPATSDGRIEAAYSSADLFARNVRDLAHCLVGSAPVRWEVECEREPDFAGAIPELLQRYLGPLGGRV